MACLPGRDWEREKCCSQSVNHFIYVTPRDPFSFPDCFLFGHKIVSIQCLVSVKNKCFITVINHGFKLQLTSYHFLYYYTQRTPTIVIVIVIALIVKSSKGFS